MKNSIAIFCLLFFLFSCGFISFPAVPFLRCALHAVSCAPLNNRIRLSSAVFPLLRIATAATMQTLSSPQFSWIPPTFLSSLPPLPQGLCPPPDTSLHFVGLHTNGLGASTLLHLASGISLRILRFPSLCVSVINFLLASAYYCRARCTDFCLSMSPLLFHLGFQCGAIRE